MFCGFRNHFRSYSRAGIEFNVSESDLSVPLPRKVYTGVAKALNEIRARADFDTIPATVTNS